MNKGIIFALGTIAGVAVGSVATYLIVKDRFEQKAADEIEAYAEHAEERLENYISSHFPDDLDDEPESSDKMATDVPVQDDDLVAKNPGVKKYNHYNGGFTKPKEEKDVTKGQEDILKRPELEDVPGIEEISSEEYDLLDDDEYSRVYLAYDANEDTLLTNVGDVAEEEYDKPRHELIGNCWRWATDYIKEETGDRSFYIKNDNLMIAFQVEVQFDPNMPMVEVG